MKKLIALVAVVTMLFGIVGTASAYDVNMQIFVNPTLIQRGPSDYGWDGDLTVSYAPTDVWQFTNTLNITLSGKYSDLSPWYNYGNSNEQAAWVRIPIIFDSVDPKNFPTINTKSTQWQTSDKLIQQGTMVSVNGVMYPAGVIKGRNTTAIADGTRYHPFFRDEQNANAPVRVYGTADGTDVYIPATDATTPNSNDFPALVNTGTATVADAIGIVYSLRLQPGGCNETLNISYTPNGVEVYKATINIMYMDSASITNNATVAREVGVNAPNFRARYTGGEKMEFDSILRTGSMTSESVKYYFRNNDAANPANIVAAGAGNAAAAPYELMDDDNDWPLYVTYNGGALTTGQYDQAKDKGYAAFPTIVMQAKIKLLDKNGNPLPVRTQIKGSVAGKEYNADNQLVPNKHYTDMTSAITNVATDNALTGGLEFLFRAGDAYDSTFSSTTKTDDGYYHELDANGEFTVTTRVIDNSTALYKGLLDTFIDQALGSNFTIYPYAIPLENVTFTGGAPVNSQITTIEGVKNRVNYTYLDDVKQDVYTYNMYDRQILKYDILLNSMDRIEAQSFSIVSPSSDNLPKGSTRQLQANIGGHTSIVTDANVIWTSSNPAVATVNSAGLVTAVADGTTYITARYEVGKGYDTIPVTVGNPAPVVTVPPVVTTQYFVMVGSRSSLNVRSGPSTKDSRVGQFKRGDVVNVYEIVDGWAKIDYNGGVAYVSSRYISQ